MSAVPVLEFDENGDVVTLYTNEIDLSALGIIGDVRRASHVDFDEANQEWVVLKASGEVVHRDRNRERAIEWESGTVCQVTTPPDVLVEVRDYDVDGTEEDRLHQDETGRRHTRARWCEASDLTSEGSNPCPGESLVNRSRR